MKLTRCKVTGLFGRFDVDIPIEDNRLIVVGENGSGKSTLVSILNFALSRQWKKLRLQPFRTLQLEINGRNLTIPRDSPARRESSLELFERIFDSVRAKNIYRLAVDTFPLESVDMFVRNAIFILEGAEDDESLFTEQVVPVGEGVGLPRRLVRELTREILMARGDLSTSLNHDNILTTAFDGCQVLFLPTYRRIERDLKSIFPDFAPEEQLQRSHRRARMTASSYIELVEFGMGDVEELFEFTRRRLERNFNANLNGLTGEYLRDIIRGKYRNLDTNALLATDALATVDSIIGRIGDATLPSRERAKLRALVQKVSELRKIEPDDKVVAHFLTKLIGIHEEQTREEALVRQFVNICNKYLGGKEFKYSSRSHTITLHLLGLQPPRGKRTRKSPPPSGSIRRRRAREYDEIELGDLSSGEKQIVSLFAHLFLSGVGRFFVIIDEPELSISVPWQRSFLDDIAANPRCDGLVAVTHSPFIFENQLSGYAHSLDEFVRKAPGGGRGVS